MLPVASTISAGLQATKPTQQLVAKAIKLTILF